MSKKFLMIPVSLSLMVLLAGCAFGFETSSDVDLSFLDALESFGEAEALNYEDEMLEAEDMVTDDVSDVEEVIIMEAEGEEEISLVTLENFERLELGMTFADVAEIFGEHGELTSESEVRDSKIEVYTFLGEHVVSSVILSFTDGELTNKVQTGLE